jgi:hypothetical protein
MDNSFIKQHIMNLPDELIEYILQYIPIYKFLSKKDCPPIINRFINTYYKEQPIIYFEELKYLKNNKYKNILYHKFYNTLLSFLPHDNYETYVMGILKRNPDECETPWHIKAQEIPIYGSYTFSYDTRSEWIKWFIRNVASSVQKNKYHLNIFSIELVKINRISKNQIILHTWTKQF